MSLMSQNARSMRAPELALRAAGNIRWAEQVLKLFKENATDERYIPFKGKTGEAEGGWFKGSDIDASFYITAKPRSWVPKGEMDRRGDLMGALQAVGGIQGLATVAQQMPKLLAEISEVFDVDLDIADVSLDTRVARLRLDAMREILPQAKAASGQWSVISSQLGGESSSLSPDQMIIQVITNAEGAQIDTEDNHDAHIQFYRRWLTTDEGLQADPLLREAVHAQIQQHRMAQVEQAQQQQQIQMTANAPAIQQQQAEAAQMQQAQSQQLAAKQQSDAQKQQGKVAVAAIQSQDGQDQRDHEATQNELDRAQELNLAQIQKANQ